MDIRAKLMEMKEDMASLIKCHKEIEDLGTVYFRSLPGHYLLSLNKNSFEKNDPEADNKEPEIQISADLMIDMIEKSACDEKGMLLFNTEEMKDILMQMPLSVLNDLSAGVSEASGMTDKASEGIEKNLETVV